MADVEITGIVLVAENFEEQVAFYRDRIGLDLVDDWGDAMRLRAANGVELTIFAASHDAPSLHRLSPVTHGLSHMELGVARSVRAQLEESLDDRRLKPGSFLDPDGQLFHFTDPVDLPGSERRS